MAVSTGTQIREKINRLLADNVAEDISAGDVRSPLLDLADTVQDAKDTAAAAEGTASANQLLVNIAQNTADSKTTPAQAAAIAAARYTDAEKTKLAGLSSDGGGGTMPSGPIADNSITPVKAQADTEARKKAWRERLGSAHIGAGLTLPAASDSNDGDVRIFTQDVANGLNWRDISDTTTIITAAEGGDVAVYLGARLGWVRVGNIFRNANTSGQDDTARESAREALNAAEANSTRLGKVETLSTDLHKIVDNVVTIDAPFSEMGVTSVLQSSAAGNVLVNGSRNSGFDGSLLAGGTVWGQAFEMPAQSVLLVRLATGVSRLLYSYTINGVGDEKLSSNAFRGTDGTWDYYAGDTTTLNPLAIAAKKKAEEFHTQYAGELAGRALKQLPQGNQWPGQVYVDQGIPLSGAAVTLRVRLVAREGQYPVGARGRIEIAGQTGAAASLAGDITHALIATTSRNLVNNHAAEGYAEAFFSIVPSGSLDVLQRFPIRIPIVNDGKWRLLAGASPYTVRREDDEYAFHLDDTDAAGTNDDQPFTLIVPRAFLGTVAKRFTIAANNPADGNVHFGLNLNLNGTGTELTATIYYRGSISGYSITQVAAR